MRASVLRRARQQALLAALTVAVGAPCASRDAAPAGPLPPDGLASWEQAVDGAIENRGLARVERIGERWALTVHCDGRHSVYLAEAPESVTSFEGRIVRARYHYEERARDVQCVRAPCPPAYERVAVIERLSELLATEADAARSEEACRVPVA